MAAIAEAEFLFEKWALWKRGGLSGGLGYPKEAPFMRNSGRSGNGDAMPDIDLAIRCAALDAAIESVGGIHQTVLRLFYLLPKRGAIERVQTHFGIARRTAYLWLDGARVLVWEKYLQKVDEKVA